ncbi:MAG: hypothetical protein LBC95_02305, partial [Candidatus Nomurabacteria bacterium]|nr:hypothetical protein [Candidatus Nomurabacteria bacterium]
AGKVLRRGFYVPLFAAINVAAIVLFMIYPGSAIRGAAADQMIIDDLDKVSRAISRYANINDKLPEGLDALGRGQLNREIGAYEYRVITEPPTDGGRYSAQYEICTDGFVTNVGGGNYWSTGMRGDFYNHTAGRNCFEKSVSVYISPYSDVNTTKSVESSTGVDSYNYFE